MARRQSLAAWVQRNVVVTDGRQSGKRLRLEPWQRGILDVIDREPFTTFAIRAGAQIGKTATTFPVGIRAAVEGRGCLVAGATDHGMRDTRRRLDRILDASASISDHFAPVRSGQRSLSTASMRVTNAQGWLGLAAAGSASQLSSRTAQVAIADELARWPATVRSGEGSPLALLEARLADWGDDAVLIAISSPVHAQDGIERLYRSGDRRRLEYLCETCGARTPFVWEQITGREQGEAPAIACAACGVQHDERARLRMLRSAVWVAQREQPEDERCASFHAGRLDSARSSLAQVCYGFRKARLAVQRGEPRALASWRNLALGLPGESGAADVSALHEGRGQGAAVDVEQVTCGVDVMGDRLVHVVLGFSPADLRIAVLDWGSTTGDTNDPEPWEALAARLHGQTFAGLPVSVVSVDSGWSTTAVRRETARRRWWIPCKGIPGEGRPIARQIGASGIASVGVDDAKSWWTGRVNAGRVRLPADIDRGALRELVASEALTAEGPELRWRRIAGCANHLFDAAVYAVHGRHFRPLVRRQRRAARWQTI